MTACSHGYACALSLACRHPIAFRDTAASDVVGTLYRVVAPRVHGGVSRRTVKHAIRLVIPALLFVGAATGLWFSRNTWLIALFVSTVAASLLSLAANPAPWDTYRTAELPLLPVILIGIGLLVTEVSRRSRPVLQSRRL